jgi:hypothetical protein
MSVTRRWTAPRRFNTCRGCGEPTSGLFCETCGFEHTDGTTETGVIEATFETHGGDQLVITAERDETGSWEPLQVLRRRAGKFNGAWHREGYPEAVDPW